MTTAVFIACCLLSIRPARYGAKASRRPLRLLPQQLRWRWLDDQSLELSFALPAGVYATAVARELIA